MALVTRAPPGPTTWAALGLAAGIVLAGCIGGAEPVLQAVTQQQDADRDGYYEWVGVRVLAPGDLPATVGELDIIVTTAHGDTYRQACKSPELDDGACSQPLLPGETWSGSTIYVYCTSPGEHRLEIAFPSGQRWAQSFWCDESAT